MLPLTAVEVEACYKTFHRRLRRVMACAALSPFSLTCFADRPWKKPLCYSTDKKTIHLNNPKCAAEAVPFITGKVGGLIHSHCLSRSHQMYSVSWPLKNLSIYE
ncbi:hypothetical protein GOODEAATRI_028212 [Goodea atripinnis]|uniref:Uncharacterized protein n=1 Tax=Goodea atripinnis TaxID=208336 RepID=A0ABV0PSH0_9TELE